MKDFKNIKAYRKKQLPCLTHEEFEKNMKVLIRWTKDNGCYTTVSRYLNKKDDIYKKIQASNEELKCFTFGDALHLIPFVDKKFKELGTKYWRNNIEPLSDKFKDSWIFLDGV